MIRLSKQTLKHMHRSQNGVNPEISFKIIQFFDTVEGPEHLCLYVRPSATPAVSGVREADEHQMKK